MSDFPYPGLRPFRREESDIFFGREDHADQLLEKISQNRFISVVGLSGCGKSSLVRAGMIAALEIGYLSSAGAQWQVAAMRPGDHPLRNLVNALLADSALGPECAEHFSSWEGELTPRPPLFAREGAEVPPSLSKRRGLGDEFLKPGDVSPQADAERLSHFIASHGSLGLVEVLREIPLPARTNFLLLVDQFEEIFRYHRQGNRNEAEAFVALLLTSAAQRDVSVPIYVVTTMRSDFIGDCAFFRGLPEMVNRSQFLVPRLTREQQRMAMIGPARVFGGDIEPRLVNRLLDEMGADPDQLPLLQHCLMQMWTKKTSEVSEISEVCLALHGYEAVGGLENALSNHADEAFVELDDKRQHVAEIMFRCLSERGANQRDTRRPVRLREVASVAGVSASEVIEVVEVFRHPDLCFLTPAAGVPLEPDSVLDISHESLIRQWRRMNEWVGQEAESAEIYQRLEQTACLWKQGQAALWSTPDLENALAWKEREKPTTEWASRYSISPPFVKGGQGGFETAMEFLDASARNQEENRLQEERDRQRELKRIRRRFGIAVVALILSVIALVGVFRLWRKATDAEAEAKKQIQITIEAKRDAEEQAKIAQENLRQSKLNEINARNHTSKALFLTHDELGAVLEGVKAGVNATRTNVPAILKFQTIFNLLELTGGVHEKNRLEGHKLAVMSVTFSPDGTLCASGSGDGTIKLWNVADGREITTLRGGYSRFIRFVQSVAFSPDGTLLASGSADGSIKLWQVADGSELTRLQLQGPAVSIQSVAFSPDGTVLAAGRGDGTIRLWQVLDGNELITLQGHPASVQSIRFSPDGTLLASGSTDKTIKLWQIADGRELSTLEGHSDNVLSIDFSPDGTLLASGSSDDTIKLWQVADGQELTTLHGHAHTVLSVAFSPDGTMLVSGSHDKTIILWKISNGSMHQRFQGHAEGIPSVAFSPDGTLLASGSLDKTIKFWQIADDQELITTLQGHADSVQGITFSPDGTLLASGCWDGTIKLWQVADGQELSTLHGHISIVRSVDFSPDGTLLASGSWDSTIKLWQVADGRELTTFQGHSDRVWDVTFSPDGTLLASASWDNTIKLWQVADGRELATFQGHSDKVWAVAFSPDGKLLASGSADKTIKLWQVADGRELSTFHGHDSLVRSVMFSPDGRLLVSGSNDQTIKLWQVADGHELITLHGHSSDVLSVDFSSDDTLLASGSDDTTIKLWNVADGSEIVTLHGHTGRVNSVTFSPDGTLFASGSGDKTIKLWHLDLGYLLVRGCKWLHGYLKTNPNVSDADRRMCDDLLRNDRD